jgi:hypothetical protein
VDTEFVSVLEKCSFNTTLHIDSAGLITGFLIKPGDPLTASALSQKMKEFPGKASLVLITDGKLKEEYQSNLPLAVGSAFKLAVLDLLQEKIQKGTLAWSQVVTLKKRDLSIPSGFLRDWPVGSLLTLDTLAKLMISQSDNTATDALIGVVGAKELAQRWPTNRPFLRTRETSQLKSKHPKSQEFLSAFLSATTPEGKQEVLNQMEDFPIPPFALWRFDSESAKVEWFFTPVELCNLASKLSHLELFSINPGVANPKAWKKIAFKGGSEPGVLNLTTWLQAPSGKTHCLSATWNAPKDLDSDGLTEAYQRTVSSLEEPKP